MHLVGVKKLKEDAILPKYANVGDAGADLFSIEETVIKARGRALIKTGIALELQEFTEAQIRSRSGLALKQGIFVLNSPGTIDEGYRGEIGVILYNSTDEDFIVNKHMKIAQMVIKPVYQAKFLEVEELTDSVRGDNGFGSTGV